MKTVLCYGDSNTYGYDPKTGLRFPRNIRYTGRLQTLLGDDYNVVEEGCNGRTTIYRDPENEWKNGLDYLKPCLNSHKPVDFVVLMLGTNDLKKVFCLSAEDIAKGVATLCDVIYEFTEEKQQNPAEIILVSPPKIGDGIMSSPFCVSFAEDSISRSKELPYLYEIVSGEKGCKFLNAAKYIEPSDTDSVHLTAEGHGILAEKLAELIKQ